MAHHVLHNENWNVPATIVYGDGQAYHLWHDHGSSGPGSNHGLGPTPLEGFHFLHQFGMNEWPFFDGSGHPLLPCSFFHRYFLRLTIMLLSLFLRRVL